MSVTPETVLAKSSNVPTRIRKLGYSVLFLFAVASAIQGWSSKDGLATLVLIVVLIFGFGIALLGFTWMAESKSQFSMYSGYALTTVTLLGVVTLFL